MVVEVGKVLGWLADGWWVQVHDFTPEGEKSHKRGRLIAAASLHQADLSQLAAVTAGREILARLHELYYGNLEGDPLAALKQASLTLKEEFTGIELVSVTLVEGAMYVVVVGPGGVWTKIAGKEGWIVDTQRPAGESLALSGWVKGGQIVVGGNSQFWQVLTLGAVRATVANATTAAEMAEVLGAVVHGHDLGVGGVGIILQIQNPKPANAAMSRFPTKAKLAEKIRRFIPRPAGPIYISAGDKESSRRRNMWIGVGFLALLLLLVGGGQWRRGYVQKRQSQQASQIEDLVHEFNEAQALAELNPTRSRQLLAQVQADLPKLNAKKKDPRVAQVEANLGQVLGLATGVKSVTAEEVLDLGWLRPGMTGTQLIWLDGQLGVLDPAQDRLVVVDPDKKSGSVVVGKPDLGEAKLVAGYPGKIEVLSDKGIVECSQTGSCKGVVAASADWSPAVDMKMFAGNIYLLTSSNIWRFQVSDTGFGTAQGWLASGEDNSRLATSSHMAIDAFVWVMQSGGQILKYSHGVREDFGVVGLDQPFAPGAIIYTDADATKLYVLDRGHGRVVVLDKAGNYKLQYHLDAARQATDLVVDEAGSKLYLLAGSKIWAAKL